jgi:hypothetical protein
MSAVKTPVALRSVSSRPTFSATASKVDKAANRTVTRRAEERMKPADDRKGSAVSLCATTGALR